LIGGAGPIIGSALTGLVQPTQSGDLTSHLLGGGIGTALGGLGKAISGSKAAQAMRDLAVRITPGRMLPLGKEWERFAARLPGLNLLIGHGRQVSLDDFQRALYRDALEPLSGAIAPTGVGSKGLDQLYKTITGRLNNALASAELPAGSNLPASLAPIIAKARQQLNEGPLRRFGNILNNEVNQPIVRNQGRLSGSRLGGPGGIIAQLNKESRDLWRSQDPQEKRLASLIDQVESAILDNAQFGGVGGRAEFDAARNAYARYKTLMRAGSGAKAEGKVDPDTLLAELRRQNQDLFTRGGMRLEPMAKQARRAGVPTVAETDPQISPWTTGETLGLGALGYHLAPEQAATTALTLGLPSLLYNRPGMSAAQALSRYGTPLATFGASAAGQADLESQ
jgi:hypothetical protein